MSNPLADLSARAWNLGVFLAKEYPDLARRLHRLFQDDDKSGIGKGALCDALAIELGEGEGEASDEFWQEHCKEAQRLELEVIECGFNADENCVRSMVRLEEPITR